MAEQNDTVRNRTEAEQNWMRQYETGWGTKKQDEARSNRIKLDETVRNMIRQD